MVKNILIVALVLLTAVLAYAAMQPDSFRVERKTAIKAAPDKVFANLNDFSQWGAWSPWEKLDPQMKREFSAAKAGKGARYAWASDKVGTGHMEILESTPASRVKIKLDFTKPFEAHNLVDFTIVPQGQNADAGSEVTWPMYGPANFVSKLMGVFMSMDKMVGKDFEAGLRDLKAVSEK